MNIAGQAREGRRNNGEKEESGIGLIVNARRDGFTLILRALARHEPRSHRDRITRSLGHSDTQDRVQLCAYACRMTHISTRAAVLRPRVSKDLKF